MKSPVGKSSADKGVPVEAKSSSDNVSEDASRDEDAEVKERTKLSGRQLHEVLSLVKTTGESMKSMRSQKVDRGDELKLPENTATSS